MPSKLNMTLNILFLKKKWTRYWTAKNICVFSTSCTHKCISFKKKKKGRFIVWLQSKAWMWGAELLSFSSTWTGDGETSTGSLRAFCHLSLPPHFLTALFASRDVQNVCGCRCQTLTCWELFLTRGQAHSSYDSFMNPKHVPSCTNTDVSWSTTWFL